MFILSDIYYSQDIASICMSIPSDTKPVITADVTVKPYEKLTNYLRKFYYIYSITYYCLLFYTCLNVCKRENHYQVET
jgi:hypothetical protein